MCDAGFTARSSIRIWSAAVPKRAASFWLSPSIFRPLAVSTTLVSSVAMATTAADLESATKRIPSGPKASWLIDLNSALPVLKSAVQFSAWVDVAATATVAAVMASDWSSGFMV